MAITSAGILLFRHADESMEVLLVHPGGPFWRKKDLGAWSIPKGVVHDGEDLLTAAKREFEEETGFHCPEGETLSLGEVKLASGKRVHAWAVEGTVTTANCRSNVFSMEWPPKSGQSVEFPEVDQWEYFPLAEAQVKINKAQGTLIDRLLQRLG